MSNVNIAENLDYRLSVLMSVYYKETPAFLVEAMESIVHQTLLPNEIVIVKDGPLTEELDNIIADYDKKYPNLLKIVALEKNMGLGKALQIGVEHCSYDYIARMDSDDISALDRFEVQIKYLKEHPEIDILGGQYTEFEGEPNNIIAEKLMPLKHEDIYSFGKWRCPMNHVTVLFKKKAVIEAGNYLPFNSIEDYYLWIRMLLNGAKFENLNIFFVNVRAGRAMYKRRATIAYFMECDLPLQIEAFKLKYTNLFQFLRNSILKFLLRAMPEKLMGLYYQKFLRKEVKNDK